MRVIAFTGPKTCGKDTAAKALFRQNLGNVNQFFRKAQFASGVKTVCHDFFGWSYEEMEDAIFKETPVPLWKDGPEIEPRWPMMDIANWMRDKYGRDIHAIRWERIAAQHHFHWGAEVITDLRFPDEELPAIRRYDSLVIYIERKEAEEQLASAQAAGDAKALNPSEMHYARLREEADVILANNGSKSDLNAQVMNLVRAKFGHWRYWS